MKPPLGILGGTFDPPHYGHLAAAAEVQHRLGLETVLWVPAGSPPHKDLQLVTPPHHRLMMLRLALRDNAGFEISELELERDGPSYTVNTLVQLQRRLSDRALHLIIGSDEFASLPTTWRHPEQLPLYAHLAVMVRYGISFDATDVERRVPALVGAYTLVPVPNLQLSSTALRDRVRLGLPIRYLVPEAVREYIAREGLYKATPMQGAPSASRGAVEPESDHQG